MTLHINGERRDLPDGLAVELNLEIVPRAQWEATVLKDGDKLEVVHFVGGGSGSAKAMIRGICVDPW